MTQKDAVTRHYANPSLLSAIDAGLRSLGKDPEALQPRDLSPVDEFHIRGRESTAETAALAQFPAGSHILDIGSGIGGPSRHLASEFGLRVTGVDLNPSYCEIASTLAKRVGLGDHVDYREGDATQLPFEDASFDGVWTQHASMNIEDKGAFYSELARVLRPGGIAAMYDIHAKPEGPVYHPVPWAREPSISFLCSSQEVRNHLAGNGLVEQVWNDDSERALVWFNGRLAHARENGLSPLGLHLLFGDDWAAMAANIARNMAENRIGVLQAILRKGP